MPNRKKSNISRKLPPVTRTTVAIWAHRVGSDGARSGIEGSIAQGVGAGVRRRRALDESHARRSVPDLAARAEVAALLAAGGEALVGKQRALFPAARAFRRRRRAPVPRYQDEPQPG